MTTIVALKTDLGFFLGADKQVTEGHLKHPDNYEKIFRVDEITLVASTGSVGFCQQILEQTIKEIKVSKIMEDSETPIDITELARDLASKNFFFPLQFRRYTPNDFLIAGMTNKGEIKGFCIGADGSKLEIGSYAAAGSGAEIALSIVSLGYNEKDTIENSAALVYNALINASKNDIYTNEKFSIYSIYLNEQNEVCLKKWDFEVKPTPIQKDEK